MPTARTLKVGVAGLGFGAAVHAPALLAMRGIEVVGIAGRCPIRAHAAADKLGIKKGYGSVQEMLASGLDAITLALPPDQTAQAVQAALDTNVAILCEKPLGVDAGMAIKLANQATNRVTAMDFIFGELVTFRRLQQLIASEQYGKVREVQITWLTESWAYRNRQWSWKTDAEQGGGVIALFGSHILFLVEWIFGKVIKLKAHTEQPMAASFAPPGAMPAEDKFYCSMTHENGVTVTAEIGNANPGPPLHRWSITCDKATITLENTSTDYIAGFALTVKDGATIFEQIPEPNSPIADGRLVPFSKLAERFMAGVRNQQPVFPDLTAGARVQMLDDAIRHSAATHTPQMISESDPS